MGLSACRSAVTAASRSLVARSSKPSLLSSSTTQSPKSAAPFALPSSSNKSIAFSASRAVSAAMGIGESMMPLHSAIASTRLRSNIGVNSACWSWLSQGLGIPL
ncbi:protein NUCLEAR FUSION DEFECTIVE 6, mitochondrial-like [Impatiens glandulifera]|uniref:protein NUCLEAR FUSION DEFECTIVE 6, mitochondrial-like n=1 Tax=Impatiens glandulifera TaxID=253017 RepID=UPI001FB096A1|nr:protein NUCLEAR FUSION DEFECTIVE 6, mitochondrial-like [Impatiens glandulifera]